MKTPNKMKLRPKHWNKKQLDMKGNCLYCMYLYLYIGTYYKF